MSGWLENLAHAAAAHPARKKSCILLWMSGGPSTIDLFDLKPGHKNGGPYKEIATAVPGIKISENLPGIAKHMKRMAIIRSMSTKEADHGRATYLMRTGRAPGGVVKYPTLGSLVSKELEAPRRAVARLREHRARPVRQFGGLRPGLSRPALRSARRGQRRLGRPRRRLPPGAAGGGSRPAHRREDRPRRRPARSARRSQQGVPGRPLRPARRSPIARPISAPSR